MHFEYPHSVRTTTADDYHGHRIEDPYRWMEALDMPEVKAWIEAQNAVTHRYLASLPLRERLRTRITEQDGAEYAPVGVDGTTLYVRSDFSAPNRRVLALDLEHHEKGWRVVIDEREHRLGMVILAGGRLVTESLVDVTSRVEVFDGREARLIDQIALPGVGVVAAMYARADLPQVRRGGDRVAPSRKTGRVFRRATSRTSAATGNGSASDPEQFGFLRAYSPLHNLVDRQCYPATLVCTADYDDRVVPSHSFKFIAALQHAQGCDRPVLIRVETQASHGYRPTDKRIAELANQWAFAAAHTGVPAAALLTSGSRPDE